MILSHLRILGFFVCLAAPLFGGEQIDVEGWRFSVLDCQEVDRPQGAAPNGGRYILRCRINAVNLSGNPRVIGLNWRRGGRVSKIGLNDLGVINAVGAEYLFDEVWSYQGGSTHGVRDADGRVALNVPARGVMTFAVFVGEIRHELRSLNSMRLSLRTTPTPRYPSPVLHLFFRAVPVERITGRSSIQNWNEATQWNFRVQMRPK